MTRCSESHQAESFDVEPVDNVNPVDKSAAAPQRSHSGRFAATFGSTGFLGEGNVDSPQLALPLSAEMEKSRLPSPVAAPIVAADFQAEP
jgi:hypothetical protein